MLGRWRLILEQPARTLQPAGRDRLLAAKRRRVPCEPHGHTRRGRSIVLFVIEAIGPLARIEHDVGEIEPPCGEPKPFERFAGLLGRQRGLECAPGLFPITSRECRVAGVDVSQNISDTTAL